MASKKKTVNSTGDNISSKNPVNGYSRVFLSYLLLTAFLCGSLVMVIEVMGSRVIGPFYGVSLFVWTSLITVTLVALALGYAIGGSLSIKRGHPDWLYGIIAFSGALCLLIPLLRAPVLQFFQPFGLRLGSLASSAVLFGPTLLLLGFVSPYLVRILASEITKVGRTAGMLYSISTLGSFVGTILTGFYFIAFFGVDRIFRVTGGLLVAQAVVYFVAFRKKPWIVSLLILVFIIPGPRQFVEKRLPNGGLVREIENIDSYYGNIKIVDYDYFGRLKIREMMIDGQIQGGMDPTNGMSVYGYSYFLQYLPPEIKPSGRTCLVVGLGTGIIPKYYEQIGIRTDVIDIDPDIVRMAQKYFGFESKGDIYIEDARYFLNTTSKKWDYIILDVFSGDTTPTHLISVEALKTLKSAINNEGVLSANLIGSIGRDSYMTSSIIKTLRSVFDQVEVYPLFLPSEGVTFGNMIVLAYDGEKLYPDWQKVLTIPIHPQAKKHILKRLAEPDPGEPTHPDAIILTDNYNPVDFYDSRLKESVRRSILKYVDWDLLTGS